ncbi:MAG: serine/threonine protein kinase [Gemmataceae bacterium]
MNRTFLGRYDVVRLLGEGGMGQVFLACHRPSGRQVVVKVMREDIAAQPKFHERFQQEMDFMRRFRHPYVVELIEAGTDDAQSPCIIMEYIPGIALEDLLKLHKRLSPERTGRILGQLCIALTAAQKRGIIHRDLKPANLMIVEPETPKERIKVMDFGLAKLNVAPYIPLEKLQGDDRIIATGTPEYIAPEQVRGEEIDHRGDIYSTGVILYEMLTGRLPFRGLDVMDFLRAHVEDTPPKFEAYGVRVPPAIEAVVHHCLAKYPRERPQTARELYQLYEKALGQKLLPDHEIPPEEPDDAVAPVTPATLPTQLSPETVVHHLEAWMPEAIAVIKLRGFVEDMGGQVVESIPGMVRVRMGGPNCKYQMVTPGPKSWFSRGKDLHDYIDIELHMQKKEVNNRSVLHITMLLKPSPAPEKSPPVPHRDYFNCCDRIYAELRSYLMGS